MSIYSQFSLTTNSQFSRLQAVPLSQLSPSRERKEIGEKNKSALRENEEHEAPIYFSADFLSLP